MTTATEEHALPPATTQALTPAQQRGRLIITDKALTKIAGQILLEMPGVGGSRGGVLGLGRGSDLATRPQVEVILSGRIASLSVEVGLSYPVPLRTTTEDIRTQLIDGMARLAGVEVRQVDIRVVWLKTVDELAPLRRLK